MFTVVIHAVLNVKTPENALLESLGIFSVMLHAMHTQNVLITVTVHQVTDNDIDSEVIFRQIISTRL